MAVAATIHISVQTIECEASDIRHNRTTIRRVMTPSTPWGHERGQLPHRLRVRNQTVGRRQARRLSRRFARVGVTTPPDRLRQMLAGAPAAYAEVADFNFALIATQLKREQLVAKIRRMRCDSGSQPIKATIRPTTAASSAVLVWVRSSTKSEIPSPCSWP